MPSDPRTAINAIYRIEAPKLIAGLSRLLRDIGQAEDLAQDALIAALESWPNDGIPDNPGAWLMTTAKNRAINQLRRRGMLTRKHAELGHELDSQGARFSSEDLESALDDDIGDDLLRLVFIACHPILSTEARVALTLRLLGGLTTAEIARAFLVSEATIAQRIVRAKRALASAHIPFEAPRKAELSERVFAVLEVIYLIFNEGYSASVGDDWIRPALCEDALRLGRTLAELLPEEPEVHGLVALMELHVSRSAARIDQRGEAILLLEQDRNRWNQLHIRRGLAALERADALKRGRDRYTLQAAISACHARAHVAKDTDWAQITTLYAALFAIMPTPVVALNHAVALGMAKGPQAGPDALQLLASEPQLEGYHLLPAARGEMLQRLGRNEQARAEFEQAATLAPTARQRDQLLARARDLPG